MKRTSLLLVMLILTAAAKSPAQADLIARIHFAGADHLSADTNHLGFTNLFCSAEARALESQTLDKLSRAPGAGFKSKLPPAAGDGASQLRPLLDDFLKAEWILEIRDATNGSPEYALAIRLSEDRAQLWSKNLMAVLQNWTGIAVSQDRPGVWQLKKHDAPNLFEVRRSGDWTVVGCGQDKLTLGGQILQGATTNHGWLNVEANWPRLAQVFPALKEIDLPRIQMQVVGRGSSLQMVGKLSLAQALPPLETWQLPTSVIRQPLVSFTAARGVARSLVKQPWMRPFEIQPQPDQLFIWALARIPFQTFAAEPVPDAKAALAQLVQQLPADSEWQRRFLNPFALTNANDEISWLGMPFLSPFVKAVHEPAGDFVFGGFFPNTGLNRPLPPELLAALNQSNLVYYHWEITGERLQELPQLSQLLLLFTRHRQLDGHSAAGQWLNRISPALGICVTEITQTAPNELVFKRKAPGGLTAIELLALANWLENAWISRLGFAPAAAASPAGAEFARHPAGRTRAATSVIMLKLGVNIDHVATLREARYRGRGFGEPDPVGAAIMCEAAGAHGITAHLREDRRHMQDRDLWQLREVVRTRLNLEMANVPEIAGIALKLKPDIVCIVPERRREVTTEGGLDVVAAEKSLTRTCQRMNDAGIEVSLFIAPDERQIDASARTGAQFIELHTGQFAEGFHKQEGSSRRDDRTAQRVVPTDLPELKRLIASAKQAHALGLKVNAGHGLNYENLTALYRVPHLVELNIGHSIVSRAVFVGLKTAIKEIQSLMKKYRG